MSDSEIVELAGQLIREHPLPTAIGGSAVWWLGLVVKRWAGMHADDAARCLKVYSDRLVAATKTALSKPAPLTIELATLRPVTIHPPAVSTGGYTARYESGY